MIRIIFLVITIILGIVTIYCYATKESTIASIISTVLTILSLIVTIYPTILEQEKMEPSIILNHNSLELLSGDEYALNATISPDNTVIEWTSSDSEIITVNNNGLLKAINEGTATITAKIKYKKTEYANSCNVIVKSPTINLDDSRLLYIGETKNLSAITSPDKVNVFWSSNAPSIVTVNNDGKIMGIAEGNAIITATIVYNNISYSANCKIKVDSVFDNKASLNKLEPTDSKSDENRNAGLTIYDSWDMQPYSNGSKPNSSIQSDMPKENDDIEPEPSEPEPSEPEFPEPEFPEPEFPEPEFPEPEYVESTLAFSDDVNMLISPNSDCIFYLNGYISSNYELTYIKFDLTTPGSRWPYGSTQYKNYGPKMYYLNDLNSTINANTFNFDHEYNGDFVLIITAADSSGKIISKTINWSYYE